MSEPARKRILVIEDDRDTAALIAEDLSDRGFEVRVAFGGQEGLAAIVRDGPALVLCDVNMPGMSGLDVLSRLSHIAPRRTTVPFIFVTAQGGRDNELAARKLGADDYIVKPIDFDLLEVIINARLAGVARAATWPKNVELSGREREMLAWAARGKTSSEIAVIVNLTKRTVDFHLDNARIKLRVATRIEAAVKAVTGHLIELSVVLALVAELAYQASA